MAAFAGDDATLWAAAASDGGSDDPGHHMLFGAAASADPFIYLRDQQDLYGATSQMLGLHHGDPCVAGLGGNADAEAWRQAYACTELLPTLIPTTRAFPLTMPPHCLPPNDEQFLAMQDGRGMVTAHQQQVEASASASASVSCSYVYVPSDDAGDGLRQRRATGQLRLTA